MTRDELIAGLVRRRIRELMNMIRTQDELSKPCPPDRWRWADLDSSGYHRKTAEELAADRARAAAKAVELRAELALLTLFKEDDECASASTSTKKARPRAWPTGTSSSGSAPARRTGSGPAGGT